MKVKCVLNKLSDIPAQIYSGLEGWGADYELPIAIGQLSTVYAMKILKNHLWYLVEVEGLADPRYYPAYLFEIVDKRISRHWIVNDDIDEDNGNMKTVSFGFKELLEDPFFYGEFLEDDPKQEEIFARYKRLMDDEYYEV